MIGNGCEPELNLSLGSSRDCSSAESSRTDGRSAYSEEKQQQRTLQQITFFYNGRICVCDVTELQARAIITMAEREMGEKMDKNQRQQQQHQFHEQKLQKKSSPPQPPASSSTQAVPQLLNQGLSMKRSLQRFLQKRKTRINAVSPYNHKHELLFSSQL